MAAPEAQNGDTTTNENCFIDVCGDVNNGPEEPMDEVFVVETIKAKRDMGLGEEPEYLVAWKGYESAEDTWEPLSNLHCDDLLQEFEDAHKNDHHPSTSDEKKRKKKKKKGKHPKQEGSTSGTIQFVPKDHYHVQDAGAIVRAVIGVKKHDEVGMMALLSYEDDEDAIEFVPTNLLAENPVTAKMLIKYYELRTKFFD